jgi:gliding motility-associatede transport system auxiliary component
MATPDSKPSFSPGRRWKIGLDVVVRTVLVLAVMVMLNYLGARFFHRFYLSSQTRIELSSRTLGILNALTNQMTVTLYYDTHDPDNFYPTLVALANEYHAANKNISVRTVDYVNNPAEAEKTKEQYNLPGEADSPNSPPGKDLIIFSCGDRHDVVPGEAIVRFQTVFMDTNDANFDPNQKELQFRKKPVAFNGEVMFTSKLLALAHAQPLKVYFLQGDGESSLADTSDNGFAKLGLALVQNDLVVNNLELHGDAEVPMDCSLLIIAAPIKFDIPELQKIDKYLAQGGRLFALFNYASMQRPTGLEPILQKWGVNVLSTYVKDPQNSSGDVVAIRLFNPKTFVNPLTQLFLEMVLPRPITKVDWENPPANAPQVDELVLTSETSTLAGDPGAAPRSYPLIEAIEQKPVAGVSNPRGNTRIVVAGDSLFLDNQIIEAGANRDFVNYAVNWLVDRSELLGGIGPRPVTEFRLNLTRSQRQQIGWLLLGVLPGAVLCLGGLVWFARRK